MKSGEFQLKGKLGDFRLPEVVQFLHLNRKSGELVLHAEDHAPIGRLFLIQGELVHAEMDGSGGLAAFERIMHHEHGYFIFLAERISQNLTIERPVEVLLLEAHARHDELSRYRAELPPPGTVLSITESVSSVPPLNTAEWRILSLVDGKRSISRIVQKAGDEHAALGALHSLMAKGLVTASIEDSPLRGLLPKPVPAAGVSGERPYPPRMRTNLLLKAIDGRTSLSQLSEKLGMGMAELVEDIRLLLELNWIALDGTDERTWRQHCQDPH
ncbi:MAG: DUF4388 domain-containing protein [Candidatus Aminicenantes bacterium]|nr:DUF4388 domain-containing protein [Candidatus Aminicenantes bacterium]